MPKISQCDHCRYYAHDYHLVCALHPAGPQSDNCSDFNPDPELKGKQFEDFLGLLEQVEADGESYSNPHDLESNQDQWQPEPARYVDGELVIERDRSFYMGEEIIQPRQRWTKEEMLELLNEHPIFSGNCPRCKMPFPQYEKPLVHWDCSCGWFDDTV